MKNRIGTSVWIIVAILLAVSPAVTKAELFDNGDDTITDNISGLMWLKNADMNGAMNKASADIWVQGLNTSRFAGHADWRLPSGANRDGSGTVCNSAPSGANCTGTEFATLYFAQLIMAYNPGPFQNLRAGSYWTSTDAPGNPAQAMAQDFIDGGQNPFDKTQNLFAWAVRDADTIRAIPDVWLKDCAADTGVVPSSPSPCPNWKRSPDIFIDNNNDGVPDTIIPNRTNIVKINVRNRGLGSAAGVIVRLYSFTSGSQTLPSISSSSLVGTRTINDNSWQHNVVTVSIPWRAPRITLPRSVQCLFVVLAHPRDRANAHPSPPLDNNKAVSCTGPRSLPQ